MLQGVDFTNFSTGPEPGWTDKGGPHADKIAGEGARATHYSLRASCGTTCSSSFCVHRSTVRELLTPTCASVSKRCRSSTPSTALPYRASITSSSHNPEL